MRFSVRGSCHAISEALSDILVSDKSAATIPVHVRRRIVAILARQPVVRGVIQIPRTPRAPHPGGVRTIEAVNA